jgi:hypothetical protein
MPDYPVRIAMESQRELLAAFAACTEQITRYYRALGDTCHKCHFSNGLWFPEGAGLVIDFVPEVAREGIERLTRNAGIEIGKNDGARGKQAYYTFQEAGLTPQKLEKLTELVRTETIRLLGSP